MFVDGRTILIHHLFLRGDATCPKPFKILQPVKELNPVLSRHVCLDSVPHIAFGPDTRGMTTIIICFTGGETRAREDEAIYPKSHSKGEAESDTSQILWLGGYWTILEKVSDLPKVT